MKVLGRELVDPFDAFWREYASELQVTAEEVERGLSSVFGDQGVEFTNPYQPRWMSLPDDDLAHHVAHELTHRVMEAQGYPKTVRGVGYPPDSAEARVGEDLEEMVLHPSLESILQPFRFRHDFIMENMAKGALGGLQTAPVPEYGTPWHFTWAIRFCLMKMELPTELWNPLEDLYRARAPEAAKLGAELLKIMTAVGWGDRERALEAMIRTRDCLGLDVQDKILVLDPVTGNVT